MAPRHRRPVRRALRRRGAVASAATAAAAAAAALLPVGSASADYSSSTTTSHSASVAEAVELSGLVASPTHRGWYWTHSDVWKPTDAPAACADLSGDALAECQQVQRARLWALRLDPTSHKLLEARAFPVSNPSWAFKPRVAQNNDWEDIALSPPREDGRVGLLIGATGNADKNRVLNGDGRDITCETRRLIELEEPDLSDPAVRTWTPSKVFDLADPVGLGGLKSCNFESLVVSRNSDGRPTAYIVSRAQRRLFSRTLRLSTGRDPGTRAADSGSGLGHEPRIKYAGTLRGPADVQLTAGDSNGRDVSLLARKTSSDPCRVLTWRSAAGGVAATLTGESPVVSRVTCSQSAEGLAYARGTSDASVATADLLALADTGGASRFPYWFFPDS